MASSSTKTDCRGAANPHLPDDISVRRWFSLYAGFAVAVGVPLAVLIARAGWRWADWLNEPARTFAATSVVVKLLGLALYASLCTTFLPLPTGWIIAGVATREAAVAAGASQSTLVVALLTTAMVATVGAAGSTVANLNDYHLFTWLLRHHRISAVRRTRAYQASARWFARSPFFWLLVFNIIPIPIDVVRMLATTYRYPRAPFAAANFCGRLARYAVIAFATYWWDLGWIAPAALLALAVVLGAGRIGTKLAGRFLRRGANRSARDVSGTTEALKE